MTIYTIGARKKYEYDIKSNKNKYGKPEYREDLIIEIIEKYPNIPHTHIIELCRIIAKVPKITVEKLLENLKEKHTLKDRKDSTRPNGNRTWNINSHDDKWLNDTLNTLDQIIKNKNKILNIKNTNSKNNIYWNAKKITYFIRILSSLNVALKIFDYNIDNIHVKTKRRELDKLFQTFLHNLKYEKNPKLYFYITNILKHDMEELVEEFTVFNKIKHEDQKVRGIEKLIVNTKRKNN